MLRALRHHEYRRWCAAGFVSTVGSWMQVTAQAWLMLKLTGSGAQLGALVALTAVPGLVLGPWGGVIADRLPRQKVLIVTQSLFVVLAAGTGAAVYSGNLHPWMLYASGLLCGLVAIADGPSNGALAASLLPRDDLANGIALGAAASSLARVLGMAAAGVVVATAGAGAAFCANAVSFLPVILVLTTFWARPVPALAEHGDSPWASLRRGVEHVSSNRQLRATLVLAFVLGALGRSYQVTMALMAARVFHSGAAGYGAMSTAFAVGAFAGAVVGARIPRVSGRVVVVAGAVGAVGELAAGSAPGLIAFLVIVVFVAAAAVVLDTAVQATVALSAPEELRGRVMAVAGVASAGSGAVGGPTLGALGQVLGARGALWSGGAVCLSSCRVARGPVTGDRGADRRPFGDFVLEVAV
jgi:MFS family permease